MGDNNKDKQDENKPKKNNTPLVGKSMRRRKKKGPAGVVKIPQGLFRICLFDK
jgi:hypothetical protein